MARKRGAGKMNCRGRRSPPFSKAAKRKRRVLASFRPVHLSGEEMVGAKGCEKQQNPTKFSPTLKVFRLRRNKKGGARKDLIQKNEGENFLGFCLREAERRWGVWAGRLGLKVGVFLEKGSNFVQKAPN